MQPGFRGGIWQWRVSEGVIACFPKGIFPVGPAHSCPAKWAGESVLATRFPQARYGTFKINRIVSISYAIQISIYGGKRQWKKENWKIWELRLLYWDSGACVSRWRRKEKLMSPKQSGCWTKPLLPEWIISIPHIPITMATVNLSWAGCWKNTTDIPSIWRQSCPAGMCRRRKTQSGFLKSSWHGCRRIT